MWGGYGRGSCRRLLPRHGTDLDSKPLPPLPGICLPARPLQSRQEEYRSGRATAQRFGRALLAVVIWGLQHRELGQIDATGVDEIQYAKGHKYLTLGYQIDLGITRLPWVGKERTIESFQGFFAAA